MRYQGIFRSDLFKNQTVLVTGGGSGIGRMTALELASLGANVCLLGRDESKLLSVQNELQALGASVEIAGADIREAEQVKAALEKFKSRFKTIEALVNNAGGQYFSPLEKINAKGFDAVVRTNLYGTFNMMQEVFQRSMREHGGSIVNITAKVNTGLPMMAHSGAARAGVENLTQSAAFEWARYGVRVNCIAPGYVDSSGLDKYSDEAKAWIPQLKNHVPLKRLGTEAEIASAICFLLSPAAAYVNGEIFRIDGGASLCGSAFPLSDPQSPLKPFFSFSGDSDAT